MKTKELVKKIRDLGYKVEEDEYEIKSYGNGGLSYTIFKKYMGLVMEDTLLVSSKGVEELKSIIEYLETPLEEREEEKRYLLTTPFAKKSRKLYLYFNDIEKRYYLNDLEEYNQNQFTQKEIDAMPFDTNFFIKEEVK